MKKEPMHYYHARCQLCNRELSREDIEKITPDYFLILCHNRQDCADFCMKMKDYRPPIVGNPEDYK